MKGQLDATEWLLFQNLLFAQHVSVTIMPIIRSSRVIQMVAACGTLHLVEQYPATRTHNLQLHTRPTTCKPKRHVPQATTICITLELLIMGIMMPETCWADNKFCNNNHSVASSWPFISMHGGVLWNRRRCTADRSVDTSWLLHDDNCHLAYRQLITYGIWGRYVAWNVVCLSITLTTVLNSNSQFEGQNALSTEQWYCLKSKGRHGSNFTDISVTFNRLILGSWDVALTVPVG